MKTREKEYDYLSKGNKLVGKLVYEYANGKKYSDTELIEQLKFDGDDEYYARKYYHHLSALFLNVLLNRTDEVNSHTGRDYFAQCYRFVNCIFDDSNN